MTGIKINGAFLVLENFRVTFELENSIFSEDIIFSGFSIPGEAPVCEENNRILGFGYKLNLAHKVKQYPCEFFFKGQPVFYGTFNLLETSRKSYRWNMSISGLSAALLDKKLSELDFGDPYVLGANTLEVYDTLKDMAGLFYPDIPVCFPMTENTIFYGPYRNASSANQDFKGYLNAWKQSTQEYWQNIIAQAPAQDNLQSFVPWVFTQHILKTIFENVGWSVMGTFITDPELQQHIIYSGRALDRTIEFSPFEGKSTAAQNLVNPIPNNWLTLNITEVSDNDNRFDANEYTVHSPIPDTGVTNVGYYNFQFDFATHTAFPGEFSGEQKIQFGILYEDETEYQFITEAENYFLQQDFSFEERIVIKGSLWIPASKVGVKFVIGAKHYSEVFELGNVVQLFVHSVIILPTSMSSFNVLQNSINIADFVPDMSVKEFLKELRDSFCLTMIPELSMKAVRIDYFGPKIKQIPNNITDNALYDYNSDLSQNRQYEFDFNWDSTDELEKDNFGTIDQNQFIGEFTSESDLPSLISPNLVAYVTTTNRYYVTVKNPQNFEIYWKYFADKIAPLVFGEGEKKEVKPNLKPVFLSGSISPVESSFLHPFIKPAILTKGNSPCFGLGTNNPQPLKSAIWRGLQPAKNGLDYPFATPFQYLDDGTAPFEISLTWDEPQYGLFDKFWKPLASAIINTELTELDADLTLSQVLNFDITRVQLVEDVYYSIKMMRLNFTEDRLDPVELEMYRL